MLRRRRRCSNPCNRVKYPLSPVLTTLATGISWLTYVVNEFLAVADANVDFRDARSTGHPRQNLARHIRQHGSGQYVIYVACAAVDIGTSLGDRLNDRIVI